jgi:hypothetical protein
LRRTDGRPPAGFSDQDVRNYQGEVGMRYGPHMWGNEDFWTACYVGSLDGVKEHYKAEKHADGRVTPLQVRACLTMWRNV